MSGSLKTEHTTFFYHSDLSGNVRIVQHSNTDSAQAGTEIEIPGEDLLQLVAEYVRAKAISEIEQASFDELVSQVSFYLNRE